MKITIKVELDDGDSDKSLEISKILRELSEAFESRHIINFNEKSLGRYEPSQAMRWINNN